MKPTHSRASIILLQLAALGAFAVAQPLYDILSRNAEFFVAYQTGPGDLVLLTLLLSVAIPLIVIAGAWLGGALSGGLTPASAAPWVGVLSVLVALPILKRLSFLPASAVIALAGAVGIAVGWASWRRPSLRLVLAGLSPAVIVFPLWFLFATPVSTLMRPRAIVEAAAVPPVRATTPIVMVVFDEFPLSSLLDGKDDIKRRRFEGFARLADTSYWFRNATTVANRTTVAIPAMLSGRVPREELLPTATDHPENLYRFLAAGGYGLRVLESNTSLCDVPACADGRPSRSRRQLMASLLSDMAVVYGRLLLPRRLAEHLPAVDATWGSFGLGREASANESAAALPELNSPLAAFERLLAAIAGGSRSTFYYTHLMLPHVPWKYFPSGREYGPANMPVVPHGMIGAKWVQDDWQVVQSYQRHLLQVGLADKLVGRLMDGLLEAGLFDEAMIIVVADHGISFWPGESRRGVSAATLVDIVNVPFFIKFPGQTAGVVSDRNVETIDLVPTIAMALAVDLPWEVDGASLLAQVPERPFKVVRSRGETGSDEVLEYEPQSLAPARARSVARKLALFGDDPGWVGHFAVGPRNADARGRSVGEVASLDAGAMAPDLEVEFDQPEQWAAVDPAGHYSPAHVTGSLAGAAAQVHQALAVAVNGVIRATTWSHAAATGGVRFSALLPEGSFHSGANRVEVLLLDLSATSVRGIPIRQANSASFRLVAEGDGPVLVASDGRRLRVAGESRRSRAWIRSSQRRTVLKGVLKAADGGPLPETLVVTWRGQALLSVPFSEVMRPGKKEARAPKIRFQVTLPTTVTRELGDLGVFVILGDRAEAVLIQ